jgi:hypothetical protein
MMGLTHRLAGVCAGLAYAQLAHLRPLEAFGSMVVAAATAAGSTSPDLDQKWAWHAADDVLPDEVLGHGGPMRHRGLAHWWGLPAVAAILLPPLVPISLRWAVWAAIMGWSSHLIGDFLFGKPAVMQGRGPGIPLAPWWGHVGIGMDTGGRLERITQLALLPALFLWQIWSVVRQVIIRG